MAVQTPEIRKSRYNKDFGFGFYCTMMEAQAIRWAVRFTEEWLDFIVDCRRGISHDCDIVEGPMANDTIFNYVQDFVDGKISRAAFWELAKFKRPTHQICFNTERALTTLKFTREYAVTDDGR